MGPVWQGGEAGEADLLTKCYASSLALAKEHDIRSIAFPAISCGVYRFPPEEACRIAVSCCLRALEQDAHFTRILLVAYDHIMASRLLRTAGLSIEER